MNAEHQDHPSLMKSLVNDMSVNVDNLLENSAKGRFFPGYDTPDLNAELFTLANLIYTNARHLLDSFLPASTNPDPFSPVLARISVVSDLSRSTWTEVVYHDGEFWRSYEHSKTFDNGEEVLRWAYITDLEPFLR